LAIRISIKDLIIIFRGSCQAQRPPAGRRFCPSACWCAPTGRRRMYRFRKHDPFASDFRSCSPPADG